MRTREHATKLDAGWTLGDIARAGATRWPGRTALVDTSRQLTFAELYEEVQVTAARLWHHGVRPGNRVAVLGDRCADSAIAVLAVCTIGATYVALDPEQPLERLRLLLDDAQVSAVLARPQTTALLSSLKSSIALLPFEDTAAVYAAIDQTYSVCVSPESIAYMLYTSGSTGTPKGVPIGHTSVLAFFEAHNERVKIEAGDRCLNTGPFHFDVSVMDVLLPLYCGATVYFGPPTPVPSQILQMVSRHRITHLYAVGTLLGLITGDGRRLDRYDLGSLKMLQTGAEVCNVRVVNEWLSRYPKLGFLNSYGPTEATVGCVSYLKAGDGPLRDLDCPIGKPHRGTLVHILDSENQVVRAPGVIGELIVTGSQLMRGYWRRPLEDKRVFLDLDGQRFYRTGDFGFMDSENEIHFVGRRDDEVKLNGFRIHLNEIRNCIDKDSRVTSSTVEVLNLQDAREIAVAVALAPECGPETILDIAQQLQRQLPQHMVPTRWIAMHATPRLPSGKTDRKRVAHMLEVAISKNDAAFYVSTDQGVFDLENR